MSIDHKLIAENFLASAQSSEAKPNDIALAQVHATLYLAEQQRISNVIVWANSDADNFLGGLGAEVQAALGR